MQGSDIPCSSDCLRCTVRTGHDQIVQEEIAVAPSAPSPTKEGQPADSGDAPDIRLVGVSKRYGEVVAVDALDLEIDRGEFFTLLGPSGSGKTTTLRMIAGFEEPDTGRSSWRAPTSPRCRRTTARSTPSSRTTRCFRT